jgi:hypothetical protein
LYHVPARARVGCGLSRYPRRVSSAPRRRRNQTAVLALALVGLVTLGFTSPVWAASGDARNDLLQRLERGVTTTWAMTAQFHRETPAGPLDAKLQQVNRQPDWLTAGFGSVRGVWNARTIDCATAPGGKLCGPAAAVDATVGARASVKALRKATGRHGTARVRRDGTIRAAGRRGRCFSVLPRRHTGRHSFTQYCLTPDGIPVRVSVRRADSSDVATALEISETVTDADFERLLQGYPISRTS